MVSAPDTLNTEVWLLPLFAFLTSSYCRLLDHAAAEAHVACWFVAHWMVRGFSWILGSRFNGRWKAQFVVFWDGGLPFTVCLLGPKVWI